MTRCFKLLSIAVVALSAALPLSAAAQMTPNPAGGRNFPDAALRGELAIINNAEARINGQPVRLAPGLRIFNPYNALVFAHNLIGQRYKVNYQLEVSTGMLHNVWLLTEAEAKQPRPVQR